MYCVARFLSADDFAGNKPWREELDDLVAASRHPQRHFEVERCFFGEGFTTEFEDSYGNIHPGYYKHLGDAVEALDRLMDLDDAPEVF